HGCALPFRTPGGRAAGYRSAADRRRARLIAGDVAAAKEAQSGVVEVLAVELVDRHRCASITHERVELYLFEKCFRPRFELIGVVRANDTPAGPPILTRVQ